MTQIDFSKIFPRIKELYNDNEQNKSNDQCMHLSSEDSPVMMSLTDDLIVSFAIDKGTYYELILNRDLSEEVTIEKLYSASLQNMIEEIGDKIQYHGDPENVIMFTNGGNYEAALLLWDDFWNTAEGIMKGPYYVAVPARDLIYVAPKSNQKAIEKLTILIQKAFDKEDAHGMMVRNIYERKDNSWQLVTKV